LERFQAAQLLVEVGIEIGLVYGELVSRSMDNARRRPVRTLPLK
jgi:hypothetical protein